MPEETMETTENIQEEISPDIQNTTEEMPGIPAEISSLIGDLANQPGLSPEFYLAKFDEDGRRGVTYPVDITVTEEKKQEMLDDGFILITSEDWDYYVGNKGNGDNGTGYIRDAETGKPISAPPIIITKEEKANSLFGECQSDLNSLDNQIMAAIADGDDELVAELRAEKQARINKYQEDLAALDNEEE